MKRFLALFAVLVLCISLFAACKTNTPDNDNPSNPTIGGEEATLADAAAYLNSLYKDGAEVTERDYDVVGKVMIGTTVFEVTWSVDVDSIKIVKSAKEGFWTVDLPTKADEEIPYTLTATIKDAAGNTETRTFKRKVPVMDNSLLVSDPQEGVAYKFFMKQASIGLTLFATGEMDGEKYLASTTDAKSAPDFFVEKSGNGVKIYTEVNGKKLYVNAYTVTGDDGKVSKYLTYAESTDSVWTYDAEVNAWCTTIGKTEYVVGTYSTYKTFCISEKSYISAANTGVSQFPAGFADKAAAEALDPNAGITIYKTPAEIVKAAYALEVGKVLSAGYQYTLTGVITKVNSAYDPGYGNVTVTIVVDGMTDYPIECFRLKGDGADKIKKGDTITVKGELLKYDNKTDEGKVEFNAGCILVSYEGTGAAEQKFENAVIKPVKPVAGKAYKVVYVQENLKSTAYFMTGAMSGYYGETTTVEAEAADVYVETTTGGYYIYAKVDGEKVYVGTVKSADGAHINFTLGGEKTVYTWNEDKMTMVATIDDVTYAFGGTYNTYSTISPQDISKNGFIAHFVVQGTTTGTTVEEEIPEAPEATDTFKEGVAYKMFMVAKGGVTYYALGTAQNDKFIETTKNVKEAVDFYLEKSGDGFKIFYKDGSKKVYLDASTTTADGKTSKFLSFKDSTKAVFTYDKSVGAWFTTVDGAKYGIGTYGDFTTVSMSDASYYTPDKIGSQYVLQFVESAKAPTGDEDEGETPEAPEATDTFKEGVAYKMFMVVKDGVTYYALGTAQNDKFIETTTNVKEAVDFYLEKSGDGFKIFYKDGSKKVYLDASTTTSGDKTSKFLSFKDSTTAVFTYDKSVGVWFTTVNGAKYGIGTYGDFTTVSMSDASYYAPDKIGSQYVLQFVESAKAPTGDEGGDEGGEDDTPTYTTNEEILKAAYALEIGATLGEYTMTGVITSVDDPYSTQYNNVTVTMVVDGLTDYPIVVFRAKGDGADVIKVGDTITVTGTIIKYDDTKYGGTGKVEFSPVTLDSYVAGSETPDNPNPDVPDDDTAPVEENVAYKLYINQVTAGKQVYATHTISSGKFIATTTDAATGVDFYAEKVTGGWKFYTTIDGAKMYLHSWLQGTSKYIGYAAESDVVYVYDAEVKAWCTTISETDYFVGTYNTFDTVSLSGKSFINASNTGVTQFPAEFVTVGSGEGGGSTGGDEGGEDDTPTYTTPEEIVNAAYGLAAGEALEGTYTLTGVIISSNGYNASYGDITVTMVVGDMTDKPIMCYCLAGTGVDVIKVGDTITVTGTLKNYNGTIEFDKKCSLDSYVPGTTPDEGGDDVGGGDVGGGEATEGTTTEMDIFANTGALAADSNSISWTGDGFTFVNDKGTSTSPIRTSDSDHFRVYKYNVSTISSTNGKKITKIVITTPNDTQLGYLTNNTTFEGATVTTDGLTAIFTFATPVDSFVITASGNQWRLNHIAVTFEGGAAGGDNVGGGDEGGEDVGGGEATEGATTEMDIFGSTGTLAADSLSISWTGEGFTLVTEKSSSTTNIRTKDTDHFRAYQGSKTTVSATNGKQITKIEITSTAATGDYSAAVLSGCTFSGGTVTVDGKIVTITFDTPVDAVTITATKQWRLNHIAVTFTA